MSQERMTPSLSGPKQLLKPYSNQREQVEERPANKTSFGSDANHAPIVFERIIRGDQSNDYERKCNQAVEDPRSDQSMEILIVS